MPPLPKALNRSLKLALSGRFHTATGCRRDKPDWGMGLLLQTGMGEAPVYGYNLRFLTVNGNLQQ